MPSTSEYASILGEIPNFIPEQLTVPSWLELEEQLNRLNGSYDEVQLRVVARSPMGNPIYHLRVGTGPAHTVVDVMPHGGEVICLAGSPWYAEFLCQHPDLLEGRTVDFIYAGPDPTILNLERWATDSPEDVVKSVLGHWRDINPIQDPWSFPIQLESRFLNAPTVGARAVMQLLREIHVAGEQLVLFFTGHNRLFGSGVQFLFTDPRNPSGPLIAPDFEALAHIMGVRLGPGPEMPYQRLYPGTAAIYTWPSSVEGFAYDPTLRVGGSAYDWYQDLFPQAPILAVETPHFTPRDLSRFEGRYTSAQAEQLACTSRGQIEDYLAQAAQIARGLPYDLDVSATRSVIDAMAAYGIREDVLGPNELLDPHKAFQTLCTHILCRFRNVGPAVAMLRRYRDHIEAEQGVDVEKLIQQLLEVTKVIEMWAPSLMLVPLGRSAALQVMASELASLATMGIEVNSAQLLVGSS